MNVIDKLLTPNPYSRPNKKLEKVKNIVIHWVGNATSSAEANRNYFENLKVGKKNSGGKFIYASSHYIVGLNGEIIRCVPESEIAYHGNESNSYSIGIENCHPDWEGKFNDKTYKSLVELCADICKRYKLDPQTALIRHYDVTKKDCPKYYVKDTKAWQKLKDDVKQHMAEPIKQTTTVKIELNGVIKKVESVNIDGFNYIKLRDLEDSKIKVSYDSTRDLPVVKC